MLRNTLFLLVGCVLILAVAGKENVLRGAVIDVVSENFFPLIGGTNDLIQEQMTLDPYPIVGHPPMLMARIEERDKTKVNFGLFGSKDKLPNTVGHSAVTWGHKVYTYGGLTDAGTIDASLRTFDLETFQWEDVTDKFTHNGVAPPSLRGHCAVMWGSVMVLFGGLTGTTANSWSDQVWFVDLEQPKSFFVSTQYTSAGGLNFPVTDHICYYTGNSVNTDVLVVKGGRGSTGNPLLPYSANEIFDLNLLFARTTTAGTIAAGTRTTQAACTLEPPFRFGADGDFWLPNPLLPGPVYFFVVGGFSGYDADGQPIPIPADSDYFFELYDWDSNTCAFQRMFPVPYPDFPKKKPFLRFPFNTLRYRELFFGNPPGPFQSSTDTYETINRDFYTLSGYSLGTTNLNDAALLEYSNEIHFRGGYFGGFLAVGADRDGHNPLQKSLVARDRVLTMEMWVDIGQNHDPITKILDIGSRHRRNAFVLAPFSMGLLVDANRTLVAFALGPHDLDCSNGVNEGLQTQYEHPQRSYAAAVQSINPIPETDNNFNPTHVIVTFDHHRYELSMWVDGEFQGRAKMYASLQEYTDDYWMYLGRSLNADREVGGELNFNGTVAELRFYKSRFSEQEVLYSMMQGPDPGPAPRGYHTAVEFDSRIYFTGGYNPVENLRPYHDFWAVDTISTTNTLSLLERYIQVDRDYPTLKTLEFDNFLLENVVRFPMGHPLGHRADLSVAPFAPVVFDETTI